MPIGLGKGCQPAGARAGAKEQVQGPAPGCSTGSKAQAAASASGAQLPGEAEPACRLQRLGQLQGVLPVAAAGILSSQHCKNVPTMLLGLAARPPAGFCWLRAPAEQTLSQASY